ncbi:MAG: hypothetical protein B9S34_03595 [Opitutia bacterium Tous-C1TDCM]|nr:MAG: hypothetical protein B9S34_03595 [Opitutae bacterium Tous-C1TDCM]
MTAPMTAPQKRPGASGPSVPQTLDHYLSANHRDDIVGTLEYLERGSALVTPDAIQGLRRLRPALQAKIARIDSSDHLRQRLDLLALYFDEACRDGTTGTPPHCDVTFALLYFLKGFDRIPDSVPEIGLLDDALIVQTVLQRHATTLRAHWLRQRRSWPAEL